MSDPPLYEEHQVLRHLKLRVSELEELLNIGIVAPVARRGSETLYCVEAIHGLVTPFNRTRLGCALWWDFDLRKPRFLPDHAQWSPPDVPFYPFDDEEQQSWARRYYKQRKAYAPGPYPYQATLARRRAKLEAKATRVFERKHGIKRPRQFRGIDVRIRGVNVRITRAKLFNLVWSKTMIRAGADLGITETALRGLCKRFKIPLPTRGHFNWKDPKKRPPKPALPPLLRAARYRDI